MITKYRNLGFIQLGCALALTVFIIGREVRRGFHVLAGDTEGVVMVVLVFGTWALWMMASYTLAKAKGYAPDVAGGLFMGLIILAFCLPMAAFVFPVVVLFGLKDKSRRPLRRW